MHVCMVQILEQLRGMVAEVIGAAVSDDQPLMEAGLDSLAAVELHARVAAAFAVPLPATVALDYPTLSVCSRIESLLYHTIC